MRAAVDGLRKTEVDQHDAAVGAHHHIGRFQIAVTHAGAMHRDQGAADLQKNIDAVAHRHQIANAQFEAAAGKVLGDDVTKVLTVTPVVDIDDGRMTDARQQQPLAFETLHLALIGGVRDPRAAL